MASARCCPAASQWIRRSRRLERHALACEDVAAFVVEPVQGKGVNLPPDGYLRRAQRLCRDAGALFVCDEVQTGIGSHLAVAVPGARALGAPTRHDLPREGPLRRSRADRRSARLASCV